MRALTFDGKSLSLNPHHDEPKLQSGQAIIKPLVTGICSTDLEICKGYMNFTGTLGHEFVGIVDKVHPDTGDRGKQLVGKRVVGGINCVCTRCDMCKSGLSTHCRERSVLGIYNHDGCFADRFSLPVNNLTLVPDHVLDEQAVFAEPLAAACNIKQQLHIVGKPYITVLGDGRLGLLVAQVLSKLNASVRLVGKHEQKLMLCEKWGIRHRLLSDIVPRADQDVIVDCTGLASGLQTAMAMVRPRGQIVMKTTVANQSGVDLSPIIINEITVIGSRCGQIPEAMNMIATDQVDVASLVSRRVRFDLATEAFRTAAQPDMIKVLLDMS